MQMLPSDFKDFSSYGSKYNFTSVPFSKLKTVTFTRQLFVVRYTLDYDSKKYVEENIRRLTRRSECELSEPQILRKQVEISDLKKKHLISMFTYMSSYDVAYYKTIFKTNITDVTPSETLIDTISTPKRKINKTPKNLTTPKIKPIKTTPSSYTEIPLQVGLVTPNTRNRTNK